MTGPPASPRQSSPSLQYSTCSSPASYTRFYEEQVSMKGETMRSLLDKMEAQFAADCTFKPVINKYSNAKRHEGSQKETFARLSRDKKDAYRRLEQERCRQQQAKEMEECSFRPQINPSSKRDPSKPQRRHSDMDHRQWQKMQRAREEEERERQQWFQPKINNLSRATAEADPRPPIHERIDALQRQKQVAIHQIRMQELKKQDATFKPQINQTSKEIVQLQLQQSSHNASEVSSQCDDQTRGMTKLQLEDSKRHSEECPFKPKINRKTQQIVQSHAAFRAQSFTERQMLFARQSKGKRHQAAQKVAEQEEAPFEPELTKTSNLLTQAKREAESGEEKLARLAMRDKERSEELKRNIEEQYYAQFTFQPKLNKISRALAESKESPRDITKSKTGHINHELLQQLEDDFKQKCTFRPVIHSTGPSTSQRESLGTSGYVQDHAGEKARRLAEAKREQQYEELKDCTFQPKLKKHVPNFSEQKVEVPGMAKYLDRRQQAQQMAEEKKARDEKAFKVRNVKPGHRYTVPQPFKLHTQYHSLSKKEKLEASLKAKAEEDCTFTPCTNAKVAYDILRKYILSDEPDSDEEGAEARDWAGVYGSGFSSMPPQQFHHGGGSDLQLVDLEG